jgi:hypothetical protein
MIESNRLNAHEKLVMVSIALGINSNESLCHCLNTIDRGIINRIIDSLINSEYIHVKHRVKKGYVKIFYVLSNKILELPKVVEKKYVPVIPD